MSKLTLPLEAGKKYVRRDGQIATLTKGPSPNFPFATTRPDGVVEALTPTGRWGFGEDNPADLVADYIEPAKTLGHLHAESMRLYAEDAAECAEPWTRWEVCLSGEWEELTVQPSWAPHFKYRRKPRTIRIGEFDVHPDNLIAAREQIEALFKGAA
ncbi:hypothetical protein CCO03_08520 [Comamonas serinivorans]|uniref:Uncharacterized protein n=1 Tax=Comamonas serinivorans TaxID=1082851 RepID=A0A1Y0EN26_9BURK|nr:hypothetical protein [Comamonas serinivorans]ARU04712.1 hypothetical protein CCO03_08520 [Comamonas serinivorans]